MNVVFGVTGHVGRVVAQTLLAQAQPVRVVVRHADKGTDWAQQGAQVAVADLTDAPAVTEALRGASSVFVLNPPVYHQDMFPELERVLVSLEQALAQARPAHVVGLSSIGAHLPTGTGNILTTYHLEQRLSALNLPTTFVRAAWFITNGQGAVGAAIGQGITPSFLTPLDRRIPMVDPTDIGQTIAGVMLQPPTPGIRVIELEGPTHYSPDDMARELSSLLNKPVQAVAIPRDAWADTLRGFGFPEPVAQSWIEMVDGFNQNYIVFEGGHEHRRGRVTLAEALPKMLPPGTQPNPLH